MVTHTAVQENRSFTAPNAKTFRGTELLTASDDGPGSPESRIPYKPWAGQDAGFLVTLGREVLGDLPAGVVWQPGPGQPPQSSAPFPDGHRLPPTWPLVCSKFHRSFDS